MPSVVLSDRAAVSVSGTEAQPFLQNIVTTDVDALLPEELRAGALLSPQGKILFDFLLSRNGEAGFRLDCRADIAADLARRLTMYRLRAKIEIAVREQGFVGVSWDVESPAGGEASEAVALPELADTRFPRHLRVGRLYGPAAPHEGEQNAWDDLRIANGVAEGGSDFALGDAFPHDVLLDQNGGVGFRKGCFVGQEVVSRMQHRGTARRRILVATSDLPLPAAGSEVMVQGRAVGTLGTVSGKRALALVRIDRVADAMAGGVPILADAAPIRLQIPPGMRFTFPAADQAAPAD